jgi:succinyl-CoA synthetase beta subunit
LYNKIKGNADCFVEDQFQITVNPLVHLEIKGGVICVDAATGLTTDSFLLESKLDEDEFTVNWYFNDELVGTGPN